MLFREVKPFLINQFYYNFNQVLGVAQPCLSFDTFNMLVVLLERVGAIVRGGDLSKRVQARSRMLSRLEQIILQNPVAIPRWMLACWSFPLFTASLFLS